METLLIPREALPAFLSPEEEKEPLKILTEFSFSTHPINYVHILLREWFEFLYGGKGNITHVKLREFRYFAKEFTRLMEACSLILWREDLSAVTLQVGQLLSGKLTTGHFSFGSSPWRYLPHHLSEEEIQHPFSVLKEFFSYKSLAEWRLLLRELEDSLVSTDNDFFETFEEKEQLMQIYLHLVKLQEAAMLLAIVPGNH